MGLIIFLLILGDALMLAELILIPGTIFTGLLGISSIIGSCYLAYTNYSPTTSIVLFVVNIAVLVVLTIILLRAKTWRKLSLKTNIDSKADTTPEEKGLCIGTEGVTTTRINPMGKARFQDLSLEVTSEEGMIAENVAVVISRIEDNKVYIKKVQ